LCFSASPLAYSAGLSRGYQCGFVGEHDGLDPITQTEFGDYPADVDLHGACGQVQTGGDFAIGHAHGDEGEDVLLAAGEGVTYLLGARAAGWPGLLGWRIGG
jgi:hypothetical protein